MSKNEAVIIDYGLGNLLSVKRAVEKCGVNAIVTADIEIILNSKRVILPGVGAFSKGIEALKTLKLNEVIKELHFKKIPILGICLGMQLFFESSEEFGNTKGLGILSGKIIPIPKIDINGKKLMIPNNGWRTIEKSSNNFPNNDIFILEKHKSEYYFTHSYRASPTDESIIVADCLYGGHKLPAFIFKNNLFGFQFHPEKSGEGGLYLLRNFLNY